MSEMESNRNDEGNNAEAERLEEFRKLSDAMDEAETQIEEGTDTSAEQLDRYLTAAREFYRWKTHHPNLNDPPSERESNAEWYLRYQRALNGSYQIEKANFALERAQLEKRHANNKDKVLQKDPNFDGRKSFEIQRLENRKVAANWFRVTANCLTMPEEPPAPPSQENEQKK